MFAKCIAALVASLFVMVLAATVRADDLPAAAKTLVERFDQESAAIEKKAAADISRRRAALIKNLQALQEKLTQDGKTGEAQAVGAEIEKTKSGSATAGPTSGKPLPDPGNLEAYRDQVGKSFLFEVTGVDKGNLYGTDVYTSDSMLGTASVHAGVLKVGQKGVVKATIVKVEPSYKGSLRNGVQSGSWNTTWQGAYRVGPGD